MPREEKPADADLLLRKQETVHAVINLFEGDVEMAVNWLSAPVPALNGRRPLDCFDDIRSIKELNSVISKISYGDYS